ncbi:MAG: ParB/RepB/Spo0J family partition protein [Verrucomicrobiota bacterium]
MARKALGRGLGALIGSENAPAEPKKAAFPIVPGGEGVQEISVERLEPSALQPRKTFQPEQLSELAESIREQGIIQPLIVRSLGDKFELIAGERRWRASQAAGLTTVPVIVRKVSDKEVLEMALVENLQRADLNPIEEAEGYALLGEQYQLTQEDIAKRVGKSRAAVANALRLRSLAPDVRGFVKQNRLSVGQAKVLLALPAGAQQEAAAREVIKKELSVRQTEQLLKSLQKANKSDKKKKNRKSAQADWRDLEQQLQRVVGTKVRLVGSAEKGKIEIEYYTGSELERVLSTLGVKLD